MLSSARDVMRGATAGYKVMRPESHALLQPHTLLQPQATPHVQHQTEDKRTRCGRCLQDVPHTSAYLKFFRMPCRVTLKMLSACPCLCVAGCCCVCGFVLTQIGTGQPWHRN